MSTAKDATSLLNSNAKWAEAVSQADPNFFPESAKGQTPHTLWIGCSDSRVPESVITAAKPGDIFVHRNIANQVRLDDENLLSILEYAVNWLGSEHVIVVGHAGCGGVAASLGAAQAKDFSPKSPFATISELPIEAPLNRWLEPLTTFVASLDAQTPLPRAVEANIKHQVENLCKTQVIVDAWTKGTRKGQEVRVHGWVYDLATGRLRDLNITRGPGTKSS